MCSNNFSLNKHITSRPLTEAATRSMTSWTSHKVQVTPFVLMACLTAVTMPKGAICACNSVHLLPSWILISAPGNIFPFFLLSVMGSVFRTGVVRLDHVVFIATSTPVSFVIKTIFFRAFLNYMRHKSNLSNVVLRAGFAPQLHQLAKLKTTIRYREAQERSAIIIVNI